MTSTGTSYRVNTAGVSRQGQHSIFYASPFTGDNNYIMQVNTGDNPSDSRQDIVQIDNKPVSTIANTPLAATVVWDNSQINLYYLSPTTEQGGAFLQEACQHENNGWIQGSLSEFLLQEAVFPHLNTTITVYTENETINVFFRCTEDSQKQMTLAAYVPTESAWQLKKVNFT